MRKAVSLLLALFLLLSLSSGLSETRQGIIAREGQEEVIEETLFESWHGFSFWYAEDWLDANYDEKDGIEGVVVETLYSDDFMVLSVIPEEDAVEYTEDLGVDIVDLSTGSRVQMDVYHDLEDGRYYFLTLIAENGRYRRTLTTPNLPPCAFRKSIVSSIVSQTDPVAMITCSASSAP